MNRLARLFVDRPIVAIVLSLVFLLAGLISMGRLPLAEYPTVMPPTVVVRAAYPGASPQVIAETVAKLRGEPVELRAGDAVLFPENCEGVWEIRETLRKTYVLF